MVDKGVNVSFTKSNGEKRNSAITKMGGKVLFQTETQSRIGYVVDARLSYPSPATSTSADTTRDMETY
ncbi:hypothetical protein JCM3770_007101 [Rhodotorula araucariae]